MSTLPAKPVDIEAKVPQVHDAATPVPARLDAAREVATCIRDVIRQQGLAVKIQGREYVKCEGWTALGALMGLIPREVSVTRTDNPRGYEAVVEIVRVADGKVLSRASAICTRDESTWRDRPEYAIRSMAVTRATAKAFRLIYSWIMSLAGYQPTPAEEMQDLVVDVAPAQKRAQTRSPKKAPAAQRSGNENGKPGGTKKMTPAQKTLADTIVRKVREAFPRANADELRDKCRELLERLTGTARPENVPDDLATETEKNIRDWTPDVVRMTIDVPF